MHLFKQLFLIIQYRCLQNSMCVHGIFQLNILLEFPLYIEINVVLFSDLQFCIYHQVVCWKYFIKLLCIIFVFVFVIFVVIHEADEGASLSSSSSKTSKKDYHQIEVHLKLVVEVCTLNYNNIVITSYWPFLISLYLVISLK